MRTLLLGVVLLALAAASDAGAGEALAGDPARGETIYNRCIACHAMERNRTGPRHERLLGRRVGSVEGFEYSPAMRNAGTAGMVWDEATLDRFLENPLRFMPGTRMGYAGIKNAQERADLIAFLKQAGAGP